MHLTTVAVLLAVPIMSLAQRISTDGSCGGPKSITCLGSSFGNCCSQYNWCGRTSAYCGEGCNPKFGSCSIAPVVSSKLSSSARPSSTKVSSSAPSASSQPLSRNARCGPSFDGQTCQDSKWGSCCSQYSYCGSTFDYCDANTCQRGFGYCKPSSSSSVRPSSTLATSRSSSSVRSSVSSSTVSSSVQSFPAVPSSSVITSSAFSSAVSSSAVSSSTVSSSALSSSAVVSSSSAQLSSTVVSVSPTPTSTPDRCASKPDCVKFPGSINDVCPNNTGQCVAGYQARCRAQPANANYYRTFSNSDVPDTAACAAKCDADPNCAGVNYVVQDNSDDPFDPTGDISRDCLLYSADIIGGLILDNNNGLGNNGVNLYFRCPS